MTEKMDTMLYRFNVGSWVNFLSFSHSSQTFAFGTHDSEVHFLTFAPEVDTKVTMKMKTTSTYSGNHPLSTGTFVKDDVFVGSGYDKTPLVFKATGDQWALNGSLDKGFNEEKKSAIKSNAFDGQTTLFGDAEGQDNISRNKTKAVIKNTKH